MSKGNMAIIGTILVFIAAVILLIWQAKITTSITKEVEEQLIGPYIQMLNDKKFEEAYTNFTSDKYKERYSLNVYKMFYEKRFMEYGKIISCQYRPGKANGRSMFSKKNKTWGTWVLQFEKETVIICYTYQRNKEGVFKIDNSVEYRANQNNVDFMPY
jgi:hypothetical protein